MADMMYGQQPMYGQATTSIILLSVVCHEAILEDGMTSQSRESP